MNFIFSSKSYFLFVEKLATPNSQLGVDINYFLKRFRELTNCCLYARVHLHNNENKQKIKVTVKHQKNSLFFKTKFGAHVEDIWMSLIETAIMNGVNPWKGIVDMLEIRAVKFMTGLLALECRSPSPLVNCWQDSSRFGSEFGR